MDWTEAACAGKPEEVFFPAKDARLHLLLREARSICRGCPIREACGEYAIANKIKHGVWGGMSERERRALRLHRERRAS